MSYDNAALTNYYNDDSGNNDITNPYNCSGIALTSGRRNCNVLSEFLRDTSSNNVTALYNSSENVDNIENDVGLRWGALWLTVVILLTAVGNSLVCLAVCSERRLQNMTNYFLMSLAIADLLVSLLVMPFAMIVELYGYFPLQPSACVIWATMDVLLCTASIWHMSTMSVDRYCTIRYPIAYGRNKTKSTVAMKIAFVWIVSAAISSGLAISGFADYSNIYSERQCVILVKDFIVYGSVMAFYVPLVIMVVTYALTVRILAENRRTMQELGLKTTQPPPKISLPASAEPDASFGDDSQQQARMHIAPEEAGNLLSTAAGKGRGPLSTLFRGNTLTQFVHLQEHGRSRSCSNQSSALTLPGINENSVGGKTTCDKHTQQVQHSRHYRHQMDCSHSHRPKQSVAGVHLVRSLFRVGPAKLLQRRLTKRYTKRQSEAAAAAASAVEDDLISHQDASVTLKRHKFHVGSSSTLVTTTAGKTTNNSSRQQMKKSVSCSNTLITDAANRRRINGMTTVADSKWCNVTAYYRPGLRRSTTVSGGLFTASGPLDSVLDQNFDRATTASINDNFDEESTSDLTNCNVKDVIIDVGLLDDCCQQNSDITTDSLLADTTSCTLAIDMQRDGELINCSVNESQRSTTVNDADLMTSSDCDLDDLWMSIDDLQKQGRRPGPNAKTETVDRSCSNKAAASRSKSKISYNSGDTWCKHKTEQGDPIGCSKVSAVTTSATNSSNSIDLKHLSEVGRYRRHMMSLTSLPVAETGHVTAAGAAFNRKLITATHKRLKQSHLAAVRNHQHSRLADLTVINRRRSEIAGVSFRAQSFNCVDEVSISLTDSRSHLDDSSRNESRRPSTDIYHAQSVSFDSTAGTEQSLVERARWRSRLISAASEAAVSSLSTIRPRAMTASGPTASAAANRRSSMAADHMTLMSASKLAVNSNELSRASNHTDHHHQQQHPPAFFSPMRRRCNSAFTNNTSSSCERSWSLTTTGGCANYTSSASYIAAAAALSKRHRSMAANERKASKVLGIIFGVFVVLWSPFFVVNILSALCGTGCRLQELLGPTVMSWLVWFGYASSLANPFIYTVFSTSFRTVFRRIVTCQTAAYWRYGTAAAAAWPPASAPCKPGTSQTRSAADRVGHVAPGCRNNTNSRHSVDVTNALRVLTTSRRQGFSGSCSRVETAAAAAAAYSGSSVGGKNCVDLRK